MDVRAPFGGAGMMIDGPATRIRIEAADRFEVRGPAQERVRAVARRHAALLSDDELPRCRVTVLERPNPHCGLGTGTQLALAVAQGLRRWIGVDVDDGQVARQIADRGHRSTVGSLGFYRGGLIVDQQPPRRYAVPTSWRILLLQPRGTVTKVSGEHERRQFAQLPPGSEHQRRELRQLLDEQIVPAIETADFAAFSEAIYQYNYRSGMLFAPVQGGAYNAQPIAELVQTLRSHGVAGVGQSSWGPLVFAFCSSASHAAQLIESHSLAAFQPRCVRPVNSGHIVASISALDGEESE